MNNEPVAWFEQDPDMKSVWYQADKDATNAIPLYTAPRELSDEEIIEVFEAPFHPNTTGGINDEVIAFARAILKKASEK
jgi:hypothetical protein